MAHFEGEDSQSTRSGKESGFIEPLRECIKQSMTMSICFYFAGDFGGTMGLWLGASILAAVQMADYCIMKCIYCCCTKKHNKTNVQPMTSPEPKHPSEGPQSVL